MPILALGEYTARPKVTDPAVQSAAAVPFTYYPLFAPFLLILGGAFAVVARAVGRGPGYSAGRYAILVPGIAGVVLSQWGTGRQAEQVVLVSAMVLQIPTAVFIVWRVLRARKTLRAVLLAPVATMLVVAGVFLLTNTLSDPGLDVIVPMLWATLLFSWPVMALRFVCRNRVSWRRIGVSLLAGLLPALVLITVFLLTQGGADLGEMLPIIGIIMVPAVISAGFVRWNAWTRDIATGNPAAFASRPEPAPPESGEVPAAG